jgi:hypothetical protein
MPNGRISAGPHLRRRPGGNSRTCRDFGRLAVPAAAIGLPVIGAGQREPLLDPGDI